MPPTLVKIVTFAKTIIKNPINIPFEYKTKTNLIYVFSGHAFMTCVGTREERAKKALVNIGAAVLNGGFSTFLAFILLANSRSHVFTTFFKVIIPDRLNYCT